MLIATWNVNSINARLPLVLDWFARASPDVAVLQEIKCVDEKFPTEDFERLGYNAAVHGQKTYNGVAMLSKRRWRTSGAACPARTAGPMATTPAISRR